MSCDALWSTWWNWNEKFVWALLHTPPGSSSPCFLLMVMAFLSVSIWMCAAAKAAVGRVRTQTLMVLFGILSVSQIHARAQGASFRGGCAARTPRWARPPSVLLETPPPGALVPTRRQVIPLAGPWSDGQAAPGLSLGVFLETQDHSQRPVETIRRRDTL